MEVDGESDWLTRIAKGEKVEKDVWPLLRGDVLERLDKIARETFPIPKLPPPPRIDPDTRMMSPLPSSPTDQASQETNKENNTPMQPPPAPSQPPVQLEPGQLPKQILHMLSEIKTQLQNFSDYPPHTAQRLAELIVNPRGHYRALISYLHAVDRVVQVTSGTNLFPLPEAVPDMSSMNVNGGISAGSAAEDPAAAVAWSNSTTAPVGSDEALGGALLTPIPWLTRPSPEGSSADGESSTGDANESSSGGAGAQIHSESTERIDGPNGMGSIETVSVSVNGVPSTGHATRGVTQGELLRQEQRAGVVPVNQLRNERVHEANNGASASGPNAEKEHEGEADEEQQSVDNAEGQPAASKTGEEGGENADEEEKPHARGPEEIGVGDTGLQGQTKSYMTDGNVEMSGLDVEAAVGRKHDVEESSAAPAEEQGESAAADESKDADAESVSGESVGTKREAGGELASEAAKKVKEGSGSEESVDSKTDPGDPTEADSKSEATDSSATMSAPPESKEEGSADKMETDP